MTLISDEDIVLGLAGAIIALLLQFQLKDTLFPRREILPIDLRKLHSAACTSSCFRKISSVGLRLLEIGVMSNVFVYGTLMSEEVVMTLIKRAPKQQPGAFCLLQAILLAIISPYAITRLISLSHAAKIRGYRRHRIKGFIFPAIIPATESDEVNGLVGFIKIWQNKQICCT